MLSKEFFNGVGFALIVMALSGCLFYLMTYIVVEINLMLAVVVMASIFTVGMGAMFHYSGGE